MTDKADVKELLAFYAESEEGVVNLPFGNDVGDLKELFETADFFAGRYGLGGCKSLEEFVEMVNSTDPVVINLLRAVAIEKNQRELDEVSSKKPKRGDLPVPRPSDGKTPKQGSLGHIRTPVVKVKGDGLGVSRANMKRFLIEMGASKPELDKACARLDSRKMELRDYGWIDSYALKTMPPEQFREVLRSMSADTKASENFEVSDETLRAKYKRGSGHA